MHPAIPSLSCMMRTPKRIVCLTEEPTEILYLLGEQDRIVGVSGFTYRPKQARQKPRVSAFLSAKIDQILDLKPDLVIGFSNLQADIARDLIKAGVNTLIFNQRSIAEIFEMILTLSRIVDSPGEGIRLGERLRHDLGRIEASAACFPRRPRVFFEEWMDPLISGIQWVEELIEISGGIPVFPELRSEGDARRRVVESASVVEANPDVIVASWCGRKVNKDQIRRRDGWNAIHAVQQNQIYEVKSTYILQPGPAALTEGVRQLHAIFARISGCDVPSDLLPEEKMDADLPSPQEQPS